MTETFSPPPVSYSRNPSGIDTDYDAGLYGLNRVDTVWIRFDIRLCVSVLPECRPYSKLYDPCGSANLKEKLVTPGPTRVDLF